MKKYCLLLLCSFVLLSSESPAQTPNQKVDSYLKATMQKEHIPGLAYAVLKNGDLVSKNVLGKASIPFDKAVTTETVFQLASASKIYCALLLGKLFDLGKLHPDQSVFELVDSAPPFWKNIRLLDLASHQSGIKLGDWSQLKTSADIVRLSETFPLDYEPNTRAAYASADYWIIVYIVEKVTGMRYYDALKKYVLDPLGLHHTFVANPNQGYLTALDIVPQQAQEYHWTPEDSTLRISEMLFPATAYAAGGIFSSIDDLITVARCFDKGSFISDKTRALICNPVYFKDGKPGPFGLGLHIDLDYQGHKLVEHSGGPALADFVRFENEKLTFIVLTNNRGVYPYLTKAIATYYINGLKMPEIPKDWR